MAQFRLIGTTAVITVLIWLVADHALTENCKVEVELKLVPAAGTGMKITPLKSSAPLVVVQIAGKRSIVSTLQSRDRLSIPLKVAAQSVGKYSLSLAEELSRQDNDLSGVIIQEVSPPTIDVLVDRDITVTMPVSIAAGSATDFDVPPVVSPSEVQVVISELACRDLAPADRCVILDPAEFLRTATRGEPIAAQVPLKPVVGGVTVQVKPDFVTLSVKLKEHLREATIPAVPIKIEASLDMFNGYDIEVRGAGTVLTRSVTLKGPPEVIEQILAGQLKVSGVLSLTAADKGDPEQYRHSQPRFTLPDRVEVVGGVDEIVFRLQPRSPEPAASK